MKKVYLIGSMRNPVVQELGNDIRALGFDCFNDWISSGPESDDYWKTYEQARGRTFIEALDGHMAKHIFEFDQKHLLEADIGVLLMPAGKSAHMELGYLARGGIPTYILIEHDSDRWDVMYRFVSQVFDDKDKLLERLKNLLPEEVSTKTTMIPAPLPKWLTGDETIFKDTPEGRRLRQARQLEQNDDDSGVKV